MKTKEDVLGKKPIVADKRGKTLYVKRDDALVAMDEWAKQQSAAFLAWHRDKFNEYVAILAAKQPISGKLMEEMDRFEKANTEGRYDIFIEKQKS